MRTKMPILPAKLPKTFSELCLIHLPRPINDDVDYHNTAEVVDRLATLGRLSPGQAEYLETLTILIEKFDRDHVYESTTADPIARLRRLMDNREMNGSDLGRVLGNRAGTGDFARRSDDQQSERRAAGEILQDETYGIFSGVKNKPDQCQCCRGTFQRHRQPPGSGVP